jgi:hypothetical protein
MHWHNLRAHGSRTHAHRNSRISRFFNAQSGQFDFRCRRNDSRKVQKREENPHPRKRREGWATRKFKHTPKAAPPAKFTSMGRPPAGSRYHIHKDTVALPWVIWVIRLPLSWRLFETVEKDPPLATTARDGPPGSSKPRQRLRHPPSDVLLSKCGSQPSLVAAICTGRIFGLANREPMRTGVQGYRAFSIRSLIRSISVVAGMTHENFRRENKISTLADASMWHPKKQGYPTRSFVPKRDGHPPDKI